ncbi:hypothetical protein [uncultured Methylobacterium sp.]|uniref:hypothetical protein n=1 Tax=uncultured Methylobacterium sp. TaxID=157278 RepID=UPI0035CA446C
MRHLLSPRVAARRATMRRALALHRPRPPVWSRVPQEQGRVRLSDIVLALLSLTLLGALGLMAGAALLGHALAP